jgi:hypothetical protein
MLGWFVRGGLLVAGFVASWLIASDAPQFGLTQVAVALVLLVLIVAVLAFWPAQWAAWLKRHRSFRQTVLDKTSMNCESDDARRTVRWIAKLNLSRKFLPSIFRTTL